MDKSEQKSRKRERETGRSELQASFHNGLVVTNIVMAATESRWLLKTKTFQSFIIDKTDGYLLVYKMQAL